MQHRGRSRIVSKAALARQASEDRLRDQSEDLPLRRTPSPDVLQQRVTTPLTSTPRPDASPHSIDHRAPSLPTPLTTPDHATSTLTAFQSAHVSNLPIAIMSPTFCASPLPSQARALGNIHPAKDGDVDLCLLPSGRLPRDEADKEAQRREREKREELQRAARLRACKHLWDEEKRRMRQEKTLCALKKREEAALALEEEKNRLAKQEAEEERLRRMQRFRLGLAHPHRRIVSFSTLTQSRYEQHRHVPDGEPFRYEFMSPSIITGSSVNKPKMPFLPTAPASVGNSVSFKEVLTSMHGPLFPVEVKPHSHESVLPRRRTATQFDLLDRLLQVAEWSGRHQVKGSSPARERTASLRRDPPCAACSASTPTSSASSTAASSAPSRAGSWLSFGTRSTSSTAPTTPSVSPISSWLKKSTLRSPTLSCPPPDVKLTPSRHSCRSRLTVVDAAASPLDLGLCEARRKPTTRVPEAQSPNGEDAKLLFVKNVGRTVSCFFELAKTVQTAYIRATILTLESPPDRQWSEESDGETCMADPCSLKLNPPGYRVLAWDASIFLSSKPSFLPYEDIHGIRLRTPFERQQQCQQRILRPRTTLAAPRNLVFPPPPPLSRSPLRPREPPPPGAVLWRVRPVANPVQLRLKALQNVLWEREVGWEGKGREGGLGTGRERLCRVAFEGLGRSALGCEVR